MPEVSVIVPCFNGEAYITAAVRSALDQSFSDIEVIVVDDGSKDRSREILTAQAKRDPRVRPVFLAENGGPAAARNHGMAIATGKWITLLDSDDLYHPDRVARLLEVAEARDADVVADNQTLRDIGDSTRTSAAFDYVKAGEVLTVDKAFFFDHIWEEGGQYPMGLLKPMFRRSFLQDNNIRYDPRHRLGEDFLFYLDCVVRDARFYMLGDQYYFYTQRPDSLSRVRSDVFIALARMCDEVVETRRALLDAYSIGKLNDRRDGIQRLVRRLQIREIRDLRRQGKLGALLEYGMKNPQAGFELIKSAFLWRMGKRAS